MKKYALQYIENINKNIFNNFLITAPRLTRTLLFQKLPSSAPAPESGNAPVLHRLLVNRKMILPTFFFLVLVAQE